MSILEIIVGVMLIVCSVVITMLVLSQQAQNGMGTVAGGSMFNDISSRSTDAKIAKVTAYAGVALFVLAIAAGAISVLAK